jgi:hypothetical protein
MKTKKLFFQRSVFPLFIQVLSYFNIILPKLRFWEINYESETAESIGHTYALF